ncbi:MAG: hypothetical protein JXA81_12015 [Sedimentisphaerales bacterium]|nr:hypothetical protein [Sedimentisphaerales bacterium]
MGRTHHFSFAGDSWMIALIAAALILLVAVILWLIHRRTIMSDGLTPLEHKKLSRLEREILAMLRQNGGPMIQSEIIDVLPGNLQDLAEIIKSMEDKRLIDRKWMPEKDSYIVTPHG